MDAKEKRPVLITENTLMPLSVIAVLVGVVVWLTTIFIQGNSNAKAIDTLTEHQEEYSKTLESIDARLSRIEGAVGVKRNE